MLAQTIPSRDGHPLSALLLEPEGAVNGCVQINSATGTKKEFYINFAKYLCRQGFAVLLFDYRGIGGSKPRSLRGFNALSRDWGMKDMAAALDWLEARYPGLPKFVVGHSAGGQQLGLMDNHHLIRKAWLVSCSTGYWRWMASPYKYFTFLVWYFIVPVTSLLLGYVPASWFGLGEDLPKGVALEWRSWCVRPDYFGIFLGKSVQPEFFDRVKSKLHFIYPEDDPIATSKTVKSLMSFYRNATTTEEVIRLKDYRLKQLGHFGFFSRKVQDVLWPKALAFLRST